MDANNKGSSGSDAGMVDVPESGSEAEHSSRQMQRQQQQKQQQQRQAEARSLRARGAQLEGLLEAARTGRASARERREFMEEEAEQARDYGKKLAQEMARLERIARTLPPDESASVEKLRRLVATITEIEAQEQAVLRDGRAKEAALRVEIEEFTSAADVTTTTTAATTTSIIGGTTETQRKKSLSSTTSSSSDTASSLAGAGRKGAPRDRPPSLSKEGSVDGGGGGGGGAGGSVVLQKAMDDPLAVAAAVEPTAEEQNEEGAGRARRSGSGGVFSVPRTAVVVEASGRAPSADGRRRGSSSSGGGGIIDRDGISRPKPALEGKALFALGLHRIEAAHEAAAVERDQTASRLSRLRLAVARRQREEDAAPGHAELLQYLLRFEELGRHSLERQEQLRRCRAERQTLALTRELLANQARLLETVAGGVEEASKGSKAAREAYLRQIKGIVEGVEDSLDNQTRLLDDVRSRRRAAERVQESIKEDRKRFLAGTKELADECYRYEALNAHLALMRR